MINGEVFLFYVGASVLVGVITMWLEAIVYSNIGRS
jgi:hypothetical protein